MRLFLTLLSLSACAPEDAALPDAELAPPASIVIDPPDQAFIGRTNTFNVTGNLGQQEPVFLAVSAAGPGRGPCPGALGGRCLGILSPNLIGHEPYDGTAATFDVPFPGGLRPGMELWFQAAVIRGINGAASVLSEPVSVTAEAYVPGCTDPGASNYDPTATYDDGSCSFPGTNPSGSVLIPSSDWVDPAPPAGWSQCAGFVNTAADDVTTNVLDNCLNTTRLRMRIWNAAQTLVVDVYTEAQSSWTAWPDFNYLGGPPLIQVVNTEYTGTTAFFTDQGGDACAFSGFNNGFSIGNGNGSTINVSPADLDPAKEIRINCNGAGKVDYRVSFYR
ncbi:MAG TPA: hypothetical protein PKA64_06895 [Myxococcota bacterium]|nr:hypothetical protein [Myxococcota bacterium]